MEPIIGPVTRRPLVTLIILLALSVILSWRLPQLRIETSLYDLVIEDLPASREYEAFKEQFGSGEIILVRVHSKESIFTQPNFAAVQAISDSIKDLDGVSKVISLPEIRGAMDITGEWDLPAFESAIAPVKLFNRNMISEDKKTTVITVVLQEREYKEKLIAEIEKIIAGAKGGISVYQIGIPLVGQALEDYTLRDFEILPIATIVLIVVMLFACFRNFTGVLVPMGTVLLAMDWTFGLMAWTGTPLTMVTMIVPILMIAVGTAYSLHVMSHYFHLVEEGKSSTEAISASIRQLGLPTVLASSTTIIGLGSLLANRIDSIQEFAIFSCFGIASLVAGVLLFIPAILVKVSPHEKSAFMEESESRLKVFLKKIVTLNRDHQKIIFPAAFLLVLMAILGIYQLRVELNPLSYFKEGSAIRSRFNDIYRDMAGSSPINVVLKSEELDYWQEPENIKKIEEIQKYLESLEGVDKAISWVDYVKLVRYATNQYRPEFYFAPHFSFEVRMAVNNLKMTLGNELLEKFVDEDFTATNILLRTHIINSKDFIATKKKIAAFLDHHLPGRIKYQVTGLSMAIAHSSHILTKGQVQSLSIALILIFIIMVMLFMSARVGLIAILPNMFPIVLIFGLMGWLGIELSMITSLIASIAIGIAVDDTIHYLTRYNIEFKKDWDKGKAMERTILSVGRPIIFTSICITVGFSVLMLSSFQPTAVFGKLMIFTMVSALVADLLLLPSLMLHVELVTIWDLIRVKLGRDPQERIPLFRGMSRGQVRYIMMAGFLENYKEGEVVFRQNDPSDSMYAVVSGGVKVLDESGGIEVFIDNLGQGEVVGEMGFIRTQPRSATVVATEDTELLKINQRMLKRLQFLYPPAAHKFFLNLLTILCNRLEATTRRFLTDDSVKIGAP